MDTIWDAVLNFHLLTHALTEIYMKVEPPHATLESIGMVELVLQLHNKPATIMYYTHPIPLDGHTTNNRHTTTCIVTSMPSRGMGFY